MKDKTLQKILIIAICALIVLQCLSLILGNRTKRMGVSTKANWRVIYSCGSCGYLSDTKWRYCPICGADMGGHDETH